MPNSKRRLPPSRATTSLRIVGNLRPGCKVLTSTYLVYRRAACRSASRSADSVRAPWDTSFFRAASEHPDSARRLFRKRAQDHLGHAFPPELVRNYRGVGHALAGLDIGQKCCPASTIWARPEPGEECSSEGSGVDGLAQPDAREFRENLRAVNVSLVQ